MEVGDITAGWHRSSAVCDVLELPVPERSGLSEHHVHRVTLRLLGRG